MIRFGFGWCDEEAVDDERDDVIMYDEEEEVTELSSGEFCCPMA